jgi:hypothetical protein
MILTVTASEHTGSGDSSLSLVLREYRTVVQVLTSLIIGRALLPSRLADAVN